MIHRRPRQPPIVLFLRDPQQGQDGACLPTRRVFGDVRLGALEIFRREFEILRLLDQSGIWRESLDRRAHRSTSPKTMSIEPMIATTSASIWPRHMKSVACRKAKPGALILQRYGRLVPSATR
jgi:hypothetical protein